MRILLTNDDGVSAHGIQILEKIARTISDDVWIVAPELDQSGASHSLTLRKPLRIREVSERKFAVSGTPTDCVMAGVAYILKDKRPSLVLSGINHGGNIAEDVTYSGTIAGAIEGTLLGIPSIALSQITLRDTQTKWSTSEHFAPGIIKKILETQWEKNVLVNVNFPDFNINSVKGIKITRQGHRPVVEELIEGIDPRGRKYFWIGPGNQSYSKQEGAAPPPKDSDLEAIMDGYISITPLSLDLTRDKAVEELKGVFSE